MIPEYNPIPNKNFPLKKQLAHSNQKANKTKHYID